jgi:DNA-binding winged helix-turn-helix (wHTH) protein/tetratricopeptide (TPR) repeat protein
MKRSGTRGEPVSLDIANATLRRGARRLALRPKDLEVLRCLIERRGRLVTKSVLMDEVWPGVAVTEGVVKACITRLRALLGDDARTPGFIETVHGLGYRLARAIAVRGEPAGRGGPTTAARPGPRIVGRQDEMARLEHCFARAAAGERQVAFVTAEAGLGKTALIEAFARSVQARPDLLMARGQCVERYGPGEAYMPVLEAVGQLGRGRMRRGVVSHLARHAPTWLAQLPGLVAPAEAAALARRTAGASRERMLRELADGLDAIAHGRPVVLVLEDLHWSDESTIELLGALARRPTPARLLVLGTYRPEDVLPGGHALPAMVRDLARRGQAVEISLPPLAETAVAAYLDHRFPGSGLPPGTAGAIHRRTDGHPLFLVALAEHWVAHGLLVEAGGGWRSRADLAALERDVPADVRQMIEVRLGRLSAAERRLVETASVAGLEFAAASVAAALGEALVEVDERCADLARRGALLRGRGAEAWPDGTVGGRYDFAHAIYRDVIHDQVAVARRVDLHRRVAVREEAGHGPAATRVAARLAMHFEQGHEFGTAARHRLQAARNAVERGGYHEAIAHAEAGLAALGHQPGDRDTSALAIDLHFEFRNALLPLGDHRRIHGHLVAAESLAAALEDRGRLGRAVAYQIEYFRQTGALDRAVERGERALALGTAAGDFPLQALANYYLGTACLDLGNYRRAIDCLRHNVDSLVGEWLHARFGIPGLVSVLSRGRLSSCAAELGAFAEGEAAGRAAVRIAESAEHPFSLTVACFGLGDLSLQRGDLPEAVRVLERGLELCRSASIHTWLPTVGAALGHAYTLCGRVDDGLPLLRRSVEQAASMGVAPIQARRLTYLSEACALDGRRDEALGLAERALAVARELGARGYEAHALRQLGDVLAHRSRPDLEAAGDAYRQALTIAGELGMRPLAARCHLALGRTLAGPAEARAELAAAADLFRAMDMPFWLARVEAELAP